MTDLAESHARWADFRWTNALLATATDANPVTGPLAGLTFTVKDTFATAGLVSTGGSLLLRDHLPTDDAVFVERLRAAGATLFGKGNCAEFGNGIHTETRLGGRVLHPFDPSLSPGGSSGGDAVVVAAGIVDFAIGGDYGGSVRWPAQCVGVFGLRPSAGLVPRTGRMPSAGGTRAAPVIGPPAPLGLLSAVETPGVFARSPELIGRVLDVIGGPDGADWTGLSVPTLTTAPHRAISITTGREVGPVGAECLAALNDVRARALAAGYRVLDADGVLAEATEVYNALRDDLDVLDDLRTLVGDDIDLVCPGTRRVLDTPPGRGWGCLEVRQTWARARAIVSRVSGLFSSVDALVLPVAPVPAVAFDGGVTIDGSWIEGPALMAQCRAISLTGMPALAAPVVRSGPGRACSVQIVGPYGGDWRCLQVAADLGLSWPATLEDP